MADRKIASYANEKEFVFMHFDLVWSIAHWRKCSCKEALHSQCLPAVLCDSLLPTAVDCSPLQAERQESECIKLPL